MTNDRWVSLVAGEQPPSQAGPEEAGSPERVVHAQEEGGPPLTDLHLHRLHVRQLSQVRIPAVFLSLTIVQNATNFEGILKN